MHAPDLCGGAPTYQLGGPGGMVLLRLADDGTSRWLVAEASALLDCIGSTSSKHLISAESPQLGPPTLPAYSTGPNHRSGHGWSDSDANPACLIDGGGCCTNNCGITIE